MHFSRNLSVSSLFLSAFFLSAPLASALSFENLGSQGLVLEHAVETDNFIIEYSDLVGTQADQNDNGVSDIIDVVAQALEHSLKAYVDDLDYKDPTLDSKVRVLLDDQGAYLLEGSIGTTGFLSNDQLFLAVDPWLNESYLQITVAHELFHVLQFKMDDDFVQNYQGVDWAESTAVWAEDYMYDENNDYINYLPDFFDYSDYSIFATSVPENTLFPYALNIWPNFLAEYYSSPDVIREIWGAYTADGSGYEQDQKLYEASKEVVNGLGDDLGALFQEFTLWNLDAKNQYSEGETFPEVNFISGLADGLYHANEELTAPASYGANYLKFNNTGASNFQFHLVRPAGVRLALALVPLDRGVPDLGRAQKLILDSDEVLDGSFTLTGLQSSEDVVVVLSPLESAVAENAGDFFDVGYQYLYAAAFGTNLTISTTGTDSLETDTVKDGEDDLNFQDVRPTDSLRLQVTTYDEDSVGFSWNRLAGTGVDHYVLRYGTKSGHYTEQKIIGSSHTTFATVTGLKVEQTYYFQISAADVRGKFVGEASAEISVTPQKWLFKDLPHTDVHFRAVSSLVEEGIFQGYADGTFRPEDTINRAELLKILVEGQGITPNVESFNGCFKDVSREWFAPYVCYAKAQGWVQGYADGRFNPAQTVSKVEALKMLLEAYGYDLEEGSWVSSLKFPDLGTQEWYSIYVWKAASLGLLEEIPGQNFGPSQGRTRGAMAEELYRLLIGLKKV